MLLKLEGFQWATSLDLNMGYYHIRLDPVSQLYCTIVLPWGKYEYQALPMGLCNSPDIFQEKMSELMEGLKFVRTYIDDLLVITNGSFEDHLTKLDRVLERVEAAGLKINAGKSFFCQAELEYLGYWITREGILPVPKKVQAMLALTNLHTTFSNPQRGITVSYNVSSDSGCKPVTCGQSLRAGRISEENIGGSFLDVFPGV
jgi:Reverse transcriptase (RNA-dependent DNA polymerase)